MMLDQYCVYAKIYGERNTGTNYIQKLVQANFAVHCLQSNNQIYDYVNALSHRLPKRMRGKFRSAIVDMDCERTTRSEFGWKHGVPPADEIRSAPHAAHTLFICVAKHPLSWLSSLTERPYNPIENVPGNFSELIRYEWRLTQRDNVRGQDRINAVELWNAKNAAFFRLKESAAKCIVIAYEEVLREPSQFMAELNKYLLATKKKFVWALPSTKGDDSTFEDYRDKYPMDGVVKGISPDDLEFVKGRVDPELMAGFGYRWPTAAALRNGTGAEMAALSHLSAGQPAN
jgi:hypothetical protein